MAAVVAADALPSAMVDEAPRTLTLTCSAAVMGLLGAGAYDRVRARFGVPSTRPFGGVATGERCGDSDAVDLSLFDEATVARRSGCQRCGEWSTIGTWSDEGSAAARFNFCAGGGMGLRGASGI